MAPGGDLRDVRAVVTGATGGLGLAMARALLAAGATVAVAARPSPRLERTVAGLRADGLAAEPLALDVRDPASTQRAAATLAERWPDITLVVNNAGVGMRTVNPHFLTDPQPFWEVSAEGWADVIATNLSGYFHVARAFAPLLVGQGQGRFVNVTMNTRRCAAAVSSPTAPRAPVPSRSARSWPRTCARTASWSTSCCPAARR